MTHSWLRVCAASSFVGATLMLGCHHGPRHCESCDSHGVIQGSTISAATEVQPAAKPVVVVNEAPITTKAVEQAAAPTVEQASFVKPIPEDDHGKIRRRSFADITADPCFAHSADYTNLTGELYYHKARQCWTVRFASVDDEDRYGGSVTLSDLGTMDEFHSGQMVRVEGHMADPESHDPGPKFQVQSIHLVK